MAFRVLNLELPRRISGYFLLFFAIALLWIAATSIVIPLSTARKRADQLCLDRLDRASSQIEVKDVREGTATLQTLIEHFQAKGDLEYCSIVSCEGKILAHSSVEMVGKLYQEPAAECTSLSGVERLRLRGEPGKRAILEYRAPLRDGNEDMGRLHMAFREPDLWDAAEPAGEMLLWTALGPTMCMVLGVMVLRRTLGPLAAIESQLVGVAVTVCPTESDLNEVPPAGAAALGWNRLVQAHRRQREAMRLDQRATTALQPVLEKHGNNALNSLPDGIALTDDAGRITFANLALGAICGTTTGNGTLTGKTVEDLLELRSRQGEAKTLLVPNSRGRTVAADVRGTFQGHSRVLRVARYPSWGVDGRADTGRHVWSVRDITQQQLVAQMREQFLQTAAHELRTPLANIKAYAETLALDETIDGEKQREFYNVINSEATRLARLIEDLLNVSSMEVGALSASREETDVGRLIVEVIDKVKPLMDQKRLELQTALPQKWPKTHLDKDKIATSLVNVLGNAAKYTPSGGRVALRVAVADDNTLKIAVEDTGIGIAAEELPKISEKFFRSKDPRVREQPGSGLGLSLVKEVVRLHGGSFDIRSEVDQGTTVTITLPIV